MSRHTLSRIDRVAQMSMQEEIIARKKLEIIEKQRTAELAKQVVAAQLSGSGKAASKKEKLAAAKSTAAAPVELALGPKNSFNNDGSFFENFKKITDAAKKAQQELEEKLAPPPVVPEVTVVEEVVPVSADVEPVPYDPELEPTLLASMEQSVDAFIAEFHPVAAVLCANPPPPPPPPLPETQNEDPSPKVNEFHDFDERSKPPPPPFPSQMPNTSVRPPNTPFLDMRARPPPSNQPPPFASQHQPPPLGFQRNNPPPYCGPPPMIHDFPSHNPSVPPPTNLRPTDFKLDQPPPQLHAFNASALPPNLVTDFKSNANTGPQSPQFPNRMTSDSPDVASFDQQNQSFSNDATQQPTNVRAKRQNPFVRSFSTSNADESQFPPGRFQSAPSSNSYSNPFAQPQTQSGQFSPNQQGSHDNPPQNFSQRFNAPSNPPPFRNTPPSSGNPFAKSNAPPTGGAPFRSPPFPFSQSTSNPLHTIPPPKPLQLNKIPPPRELDLTAIPEPTLNLSAIKVPDLHEVSRDHEFIPTSVESLVELVAENGDEYEDRLRSRKIDMHSSLWFLCDRDSHAYRAYRKKVLAVRYNDQPDDPHDDYAPDAAADDRVQHRDRDERVQPSGDFSQLVDSRANALMPPGGGFNATDCDMRIGQSRPLAVAPSPPTKQQQQQQQSDVDADKYDPADMFDDEEDDDDDGGFHATLQESGTKSSDRTYDSDTEYMSAAKERNFGQMKRKRDVDERRPFMNASSGSDSDDEDGRKADHDEGGESSAANRKKRSRWGDKVKMALNPFAMFGSGAPTSSGGAGQQQQPMLSQVTRTDPALLAYARQSYGTVNLDEETWRKCEDHYKVNLLYQDMLRKRNEMDRLAKAGRQKYEYDSDEDVQGGTWEHKARNAEMEATAMWSDALTKQAEGKHHIGDFLPPEELKKFMEKYESQQTNREPDLSDYREYKLREDNKGFQMLQKLGWKEGQGLGFDGAGIVDPVNKAQQRDSNQGLGTMNASVPDFGDNEYDAYRKRMMLAYRFRPNPLNNPRRSYY